MHKAELLTVIRDAHSTLEAAAVALDDEALLAPAPGLDGWTRKDVLAHVEWCNRHAADVIEGVRTGIDPYPGTDNEQPWDVDADNARILEENRGRTVADVRHGEAASFERLLAAIERATDDELFGQDPQPWLNGSVAETVEGDSTRHYPDHVPHLA